jgi:hypothetical protein
MGHMKNYSTPPSSMLNLLPGTKSIVLNIGSNIDPIVPHPREGPCAMSIAFEPVVPCDIPRHPQLQVVAAAVGSVRGLATMTFLNNIGVSSSLSEPAMTSGWNNNEHRDGKTLVVPILPFQDVLDSIPANVRIDFIKTDMQGHDFAAISSVGTALAARGVLRLLTEVYFDDVQTYVGVNNDFCRDWLPFMASIGFELVSVTSFSSPEEAKIHCDRVRASTDRTITAGLKEGDAFWRLVSAVPPETDDMAYYEYSSVQTAITFSEQEYAGCLHL